MFGAGCALPHPPEPLDGQRSPEPVKGASRPLLRKGRPLTEPRAPQLGRLSGGWGRSGLGRYWLQGSDRRKFRRSLSGIDTGSCPSPLTGGLFGDLRAPDTDEWIVPCSE